ncbi:MAG: gliding motility-associated C-terminal domain-containing protein [Flavobacteriia bacterium]|nr:gliding motility-associated C-terminal domain-containing protein [Flavobacteriia bacterium]
MKYFFFIIIFFHYFLYTGQCFVVAPVPDDDCYQQVITNDPFCCDNSWDDLCQTAYDDCVNGEVDCVTFPPVPNDACYQQVILDIPSCCNDIWDESCSQAYYDCMGVESGCNSDVSICQEGVAGPFTFNQLTTGPPVDFANPLGCSTGMWGNDFGFGFILLYITETGPLNLLVDGNTSSGFIDVVVYNIPLDSDPCNAVLDNTNEIACNYATSPCGCTQFGLDFPCESSIPAPNVTAGQKLMIIVHDYSSENNSFTLELGPNGAQTGMPDVQITSVINELCSNDPPINLDVNNLGGNWTGNGIDQNGVFNPQLAGVGTHTITYSIGSTPCIDSSQLDIVVLDCSQIPCELFAQNNGPLCPLDTLELSVNILPNYTYLWQGENFLSSVSNPIPFQFSGFENEYEFIVTAVNGNVSCSDTTILIIKPTLSVEAGQDIIICESDSVFLNAFGNGTIIWQNEHPNGSYINLPVGNYTYYATVEQENFCPNTDSIHIEVTDGVDIDFSTSVVEGCEDLEVSFFNHTPMTGNRVWYVNESILDQHEDTVKIIFPQEGWYSVGLKIENGACTEFEYKENLIHVFPKPRVDFTYLIEEISYEQIKINFFNTYLDGNQYIWSFGDGFSEADTNTFHMYSSEAEKFSTEVKLWISNEFLCSDSIIKTIEYNRPLLYFIPNTFTPNGDEFNNTFKIQFDPFIELRSFKMLIYNAWGEIIFESNDPSIGWDGTYYGKIVQQGTYIWNLDFELKNETNTYKNNGFVSLLK